MTEDIVCSPNSITNLQSMFPVLPQGRRPDASVCVLRRCTGIATWTVFLSIALWGVETASASATPPFHSPAISTADKDLEGVVTGFYPAPHLRTNASYHVLLESHYWSAAQNNTFCAAGLGKKMAAHQVFISTTDCDKDVKSSPKKMRRKRVIGREGANKYNTWEVPLIKSNTLEVPAHGQVLPGFGQTYGFVISVIAMFLSLLAVKEYYAQPRKPSELNEKKKSREKTWKRHLDAESNHVEAEKELRREWNSGRCPSKTSAVKHACYTLAKIIECPHISSRDFASNALVEEVLESLGERTSVTKWTTTAVSCCTKVVSFATSARHAQAKTGNKKKKDKKKRKRPEKSQSRDACPQRSYISTCISSLAAFFKRRRCNVRPWEQTALLVLVLFLLLLYSSNAQQSGCAAKQGTYESAVSTMVCASLLSSPPTCQVVFSSLPKSTGLSSFFITVEIANSDFSSEGEYISAVNLGSQTLGNLISDLKYDGADAQCNKMSKILDLAEVPMDTVSSAGELIVRIEASLGVNANECDGSYLYASVKLTTCTGRILL